MRREVKTFVHCCDFCPRTSEPYTLISCGSLGFSDTEGLPEGWASYTSGGWGRFDSIRTHDLCNECVVKTLAKERSGTMRVQRSGVLEEIKLYDLPRPA